MGLLDDLRSELPGVPDRAVHGFNRLSPVWTLTRLPSKPGESAEILEGGFPAEDMRAQVRPRWADLGTPGLDRTTHHQWIRTEADTFRATLLFYNEHALSDTTGVRDQILAWARKDPDLGRPPSVVFECGEVRFEGRVDSVDITYEDPRHLDGLARRSILDLGMVRMEAPSASAALFDPTAFPASTRYKPMVQDGTFEIMAAAHYNEPLIGAFLRMDHPDAFPEPGQIIQFPERQELIGRVLAPDAYLFSEHEAARKARRTLFEALALTRRMPFLA